jgi:hypothetical protein
MKKIAISLIAFSASLYGLYNGSPALPSVIEEGVLIKKDFPVSIKTEFLLTECLDKSLFVVDHQPGREKQVFKYTQQQGVIALNFVDRFELFGSMGEMRAHIEGRKNYLERFVLETGNRYTWGFGGRAEIYSFSSATLGLNFAYQGYSPKFQWGSINGDPMSDAKRKRLKFTEWQIGLGLGYDCGFFAPYISALYNQTKASIKKFHQGGGSFTLHSKKKFGMALGTTLSTSKLFDLNLEARIIHETAFSCSFDFRF